MLSKKMPYKWYVERRKMIEESDEKHRKIMRELAQKELDRRKQLEESKTK